MYIFLTVLSSLVALTALGFLYQRIGAINDLKLYTTSGRWIDLGKRHKFFVVEKGASGPTVLLESGIAATNLNWFQIQEAVSQFTRTASYDRTGLGWSSPARSVRTPRNISTELHAMLGSAGIKPPYILVGHSFGGLVMRRFALMFPEDVAGIVLVDPMRCEEWPPFDTSKQIVLDRGLKLARLAIPIARYGIARLAVRSLLCRSGRIVKYLTYARRHEARHVLGRITDEVGKMPREVWPIVAAHWSKPGYYAGMRSHVEAVPASVLEMHNAESIQGIPVLVLTPGKATPLSDLQLETIGDNVEQVIATQSTHWIHLDEPELVVNSILEMVNAVASEPVAITG